MRVAVIGGGIVGLFAARYLEQEGAEVEVYEPGPPGAGSVHAAGIIEPTTAYRTNTFAFLRRVARLWRRGTCTFRRADGRWLFESLHQLERTPEESAEAAMRELATTSMTAYRAMAEERNDFEFSDRGLLEQYEDPRHFAEEARAAEAKRSTVPVEVRPDRHAGALFFPQCAWLHTERFVERIVRELPRGRFLRQRAATVDLDGTVGGPAGSSRFDVVIACTGTSCRRLGVPLTGVRGYGWHARSRVRLDVATIHVDSGIALVPFSEELKVTGGWDFDLSRGLAHAPAILARIRRLIELDELLDFKEGSRPCTPDGLPTVGRKRQLVVATGGFRLGWSFGPALGRHAARLALGQETNAPFLARFCGGLRAGDLT